MSAASHVMLRDLEESSFQSGSPVRVIREWDSETFMVTRVGDGRRARFTIYNRTALLGGERVAWDLRDVRRIVRSVG